MYMIYDWTSLNFFISALQYFDFYGFPQEKSKYWSTEILALMIDWLIDWLLFFIQFESISLKEGINSLGAYHDKLDFENIDLW